ncbi:hypothetical protein EMIHUDRAFT_204894 [Emiliania huxleyi CCMP1516]|uniref:Uncharacterized protein n=2 Tax=Emiliania huxleyi TaxID=2903 RepID=A0A0D3JWJ2_EMIH1|nr:hypothetical protein EMIHUDRAFT_204894 [Emiliania huxleyi CCMP1516]EOD27877.1 hypothetical protein EMIHUDRAFT_204894 [Emiliania huxleyi CCMP1516]|eukprot:XP_005780306.1 hypothetical protein EMIHUDRAFT_204894 [Emiliania huxleyi CCMP1516]
MLTTRFATQVDAQAALPNPLSCHARDGRDLSGQAAYVWGLNNIVGSAGECCALCAAHQKHCGTQTHPAQEYAPGKKCGRGRGRCNAWVFCAGSDRAGAEDRCFSYDIHKHVKGECQLLGRWRHLLCYCECWLKFEGNLSSPVAAGPTLPAPFRAAERKKWPWAVPEQLWPGPPPERLTWQSGIVADAAAPAPRQPGWYHSFCKRVEGGCGPEPRDD